MKLLVMVPPHRKAKAHHLEWIKAVSPEVEVVTARSEEEALLHAGEVEVIFGNPSQRVVQAAPRLRWIQTTSAGVEKVLFPEVVESEIILTNARGLFGIQIAEHVFAMLLALTREITKCLEAQREKRWLTRFDLEVFDLYEKRMGILGFGGIGQEVAKRAVGFGMSVLAVDLVPKEVPPYLTALWPPERLLDMLAQSDVVVSCIPYTPQTRGMMGAKEFAAMPSTAYFVNISRGGVVDEAALINALQRDQIAGACLDVFVEEPLPPTSPLWNMANVIVTPHMAGESPRLHDETVRFFCQNLEAFLAGKPLQNVVDKARGF
ncbi:MAG: D-2-hydroxyacid dehydrogenase [Nitrospinota bacterium]|nr:MAG: D-2-hydroxyacid dehydrogenase [Nitrospinota bacterium]